MTDTTEENNHGEPEPINVFDQLAEASEEELKKMVELMLSDTDARMEKLTAIDQRRVGMYYAAFGRYVAPKKPYSPSEDQLGEIIGLKLSVLADVIEVLPYETEEEKNLKNGILWALDSALLTDISAVTAMMPAPPVAEEAPKKAGKKPAPSGNYSH